MGLLVNLSYIWNNTCMYILAS